MCRWQRAFLSPWRSPGATRLSPTARGKSREIARASSVGASSVERHSPHLRLMLLSSSARGADLPVEVHRRPLCQALAEPPPGGNGFVFAGIVAVTAPSWRVDCSRCRRSRRRSASPEKCVGIDNSQDLRYDEGVNKQQCRAIVTSIRRCKRKRYNANDHA